ncbi:DNA adenine methylase [Paenibacillus glycanilyticus]|uniref:DNA adenine methylase n=1 Tax=Paenibacillus glycanilyticus TaxID=126569 RepID=UPI00203DC600|nr:DNA adenine methylase [Paenibacillus glycanilyticus]MCM3631145.1 DNA adenine methylase [Paenibacillus glycanilyticus]
MRYIGSKERLIGFISAEIESKTNKDNCNTFADLFCGTAVVSKHFNEKNYEIIANDNLSYCTIWAKAGLLSPDRPLFEKLLQSNRILVKPVNLFADNYDIILDHLNHSEPLQGFIYREYSDEGTREQLNHRLFFTGINAAKIDGIRSLISEWKNTMLIDEYEECLLLASLLSATNKIANIAGTYGAFLKEWDKRALNDIKLERVQLNSQQIKNKNKIFKEDALELAKRIQSDIVYLDPPYTWRHYGAYYHILETIAVGDEPDVKGKTGLRPWGATSSPFCYRDKAAPALLELVNNIRCRHLFLSYNADGLISHEEIIKILSTKGSVEFKDIQFRRYKSNNGNSKGPDVKERLYYVKYQ